MQALEKKLIKAFGENCVSHAFGELTLSVLVKDILLNCKRLRDEFNFDMLIDLCGVDYLLYGKAEWAPNEADSGFSRARFDLSDDSSEMPAPLTPEKPAHTDESNKTSERRFAVVYHLLSSENNERLRLKTYLDTNEPFIASVISIWPVANWYEREAFDLFGFLFEGHDDLRRILTDYGFVGHPLRKDFPMIGEVEMRYDEKLGRVVYETVTIKPNISVPKVIRNKPS